MKKYFILSVITSVFMGLPLSHASEFLDDHIRVAKGKFFEIYPVKVSKTESGNCFKYGKECLIPLTRKPALILHDFKFQRILNHPEEKAGIKIFLSEKDQKSFENLTEKYLNSRLALVYKDRVLHSPKIRNIIADGKFEMSFCNQNSFEQVLRGLQDSSLSDNTTSSVTSTSYALHDSTIANSEVSTSSSN